MATSILPKKLWNTDKKEMSMKDWVRKFDELLELNERKILRNRGNVSHEEMERFIDEELQRYKQNKKSGKLELKAV
jgi:hypothetical protein